MTTPPITQEEFETLLLEVRQRADTEPEFKERLEPLIGVLRRSVPDVQTFQATVGTAGLSLHVDDIRAGRWSRA